MSDLKQGDRVKWSELGAKFNPRHASAHGVVTNRVSETLVTVQWDGFKHASALHVDFVQATQAAKVAE